MTTPSGSSRFRTGRISTPTTPGDRIRRVLDDPRALHTTFEEQVENLLEANDLPGIADLCAVVRHEVTDSHRAYVLHRVAMSIIAAQSAATTHDDSWKWAEILDAGVDVAMGWLDDHPAEPELLNLLGVTCYELGHTSHARRLFEAIREIYPEHRQLRANLRACKARSKRGVSVPVVPTVHTPAFERHRTNLKRLAERAVRLEDRMITLCMIVKNEEEMLPGCLERIADHVDQMVIVDTGSTDGTREIAENFGATVIDFPWNGSFSDARNVALEHATGDWILYLDADEHVVDGDAVQLRGYAKRTWVEGFYLVETHFTGEGEIGSQSTHTPMRMFRRRPAYRWEGIVHEQVMNHMPTFVPERFEHTPVRVDHYGYLKAVINDKSKRERNLTLLMEQAEYQRDTFLCFNVGSEFGASNDWSQARPWFEEALERAQSDDGEGWQNQQFAPMMIARTITSRRGTGDTAAALELIEQALTWWPDFTDLEFERALIKRAEGDDQAAEAAVRRCLVMGDAPARLVAVQGRGSFQARSLLATILREQGDDAGAREELELALREAPHFLPTILELATLMLKTDEPDEVEAWFDDVLGERMQGTSATLLLATAFHEAGAFAQADACYQRVLAMTPDHSLALVAQAELRLVEAKVEEAAELVNKVSADDRLATRAARTHFLALAILERGPELSQPLQILIDAQTVAAGELAMYNAWRAALTGEQALVPPDNEAAGACLVNLEALARMRAPEAFEVLAGVLTMCMPDERTRSQRLAELYVKLRFVDMAGDEYIGLIERYGADAELLVGLGKVATMRELWDDAEMLLSESLRIDPTQTEARQLLHLINMRQETA